MASTFYATTPIYYINDVPHLGTAYTTIAVDVITRFHRLRGKDTRFLTGTDEHGLKIERVAKEQDLTPQAFADKVSAPFRDSWPKLECAYDDFIRTTEARHETKVQELWRKVRDGGDLYLGGYEGWYCVGCEAYYTEKELEPGNICPTHKREVERVKEASYFFRLKKYQDRLLEFYAKHPSFVAPASRMNEVLSFVKGGLEDLSVSRTTFSWGIPVPDDSKHVMYVWFDALANYWSAIQEPADLQRYWPPNLHMVGKDILRFHAVYWPAFLMAAGMTDDQLPKQIFAHGFLTVNGQKMSKSLRNTVKPVALAEAFGVDAVRYYLMRAIAFGQDGDFSFPDLVQRFNSELGNSLGNFLNRVLPQVIKLTGGTVPAQGELTDLETALLAEVENTCAASSAAFDVIAPHRALDALFALLGNANQYIDKAAPWTAAKLGNKERVGTILATCLQVLEAVSVMLWPVMPKTADSLRSQIGLAAIETKTDLDLWPTKAQERSAGEALGQPAPLFPRIDKDKEAEIMASLGLTEVASPEAPAKTSPACSKSPACSESASGTRGAPASSTSPASTESASGAKGTPDKAEASFDDFAKLELRVGIILSAEKVQGKDKLLSLQVDLGEEKARPIVAGIAQHYAPETLVGRRIVVICNLAPRKFGKGLISHGMLLAAKHEDRLAIVTPADDLPAGSSVS